MSLYFIINEQNAQEGPIEESALHEAYRQGKYHPETLVRTEGMTAWIPLRSAFGEPNAEIPTPPTPPPPPPANRKAAPTLQSAFAKTRQVMNQVMKNVKAAKAAEAVEAAKAIIRKSKRGVALWCAAAMLLVVALVYWLCMGSQTITTDQELFLFVDARMEKVVKCNNFQKLREKDRSQTLKIWESVHQYRTCSEGRRHYIIYLLTAMGNKEALRYVLSTPSYRAYGEDMAYVAAVTGSREIIHYMMDELGVPLSSIEEGMKAGVVHGGHKELCKHLIQDMGILFTSADICNFIIHKKEDWDFVAFQQSLANPESSSDSNVCMQNAAQTMQFILRNGLDKSSINMQDFESEIEYCQRNAKNPQLRKVLEDFVKKHH